MMRRRELLRILGLAGGAGLLGASSDPGNAAGEDYRALVVLNLFGGNDGHNCLVPTDGAYTDYQAARTNLALSRNSLSPLNGSSAGHTFGLHPALSPLVPLYNSQRLAWIANVGPLYEPATAGQVLDRAVAVPPFLGSHSDQTAIVQGWGVSGDASGWGGRALELLPSALRHPIAAITTTPQRTLVLGKRSRVAFLAGQGVRNWGPADLARPQSVAAQSINRMARWQFGNDYEAEYARSFGASIDDATLFTQAFLQAAEPSADFGSAWVGQNLRTVASLLPVFKAQGYKRQIFLLDFGLFDTHTNQRGSAATTQDSLLASVGKGLAAFDASNRASGMDDNVVTLMMSEFGRTVRPGSGGGSEHGWGNHWLTFGGPVAGGQVLGTFPSFQLGGTDDGDRNKNGRHVPTLATDQVGATLMQWLGLPSSLLHEVFPKLANFGQKTIPLLHD